MKKRILIITTIYRVGEKIFPIIPRLAKKYEVDILNLYQMSPATRWVGSRDPRTLLYILWKKICMSVFDGPKFVEDTDINADVYGEFIPRLKKCLKFAEYNLVIVDNNITVKGGHVNEIYEYFKSRGLQVLACPHANREYRGYKVLKRIKRHYDYSFVFGKKEKEELSKASKKFAKYKNRLLPAGIPSNDALVNYKRGNKYILVIPNFSDPAHIGGQSSRATPFTRKTFEELDLAKLASEYGCHIVIKEKNRLFHQTSVLRDSLRCHKNIDFMIDCEDDNKLIADAKVVISAPSTLAFKSIQLGIPTVLLRKHGMVGNFYDFPGFINCNWKEMKREVDFQEKHGRYKDFIKNTLTGGLEFNSTEKYLNIVDKFL